MTWVVYFVVASIVMIIGVIIATIMELPQSPYSYAIGLASGTIATIAAAALEAR